MPARCTNEPCAKARGVGTEAYLVIDYWHRMRVIAGTAGGRKLEAPKGMLTRPTPDRVREALFSILYDRAVDARVLDLFAGTGALGIEALSRGAAYAVFVELDLPTAAVVRKNIQAVGFAERARVLTQPAGRAIAELTRSGDVFDLAFLDPPYDDGLLGPTMSLLDKSPIISVGALVVCEHRSSDKPPEPPPSFVLEDTRGYGEVSLSFYLRAKGHAS